MFSGSFHSTHQKLVTFCGGSEIVQPRDKRHSLSLRTPPRVGREILFVAIESLDFSGSTQKVRLLTRVKIQIKMYHPVLRVHPFRPVERATVLRVPPPPPRFFDTTMRVVFLVASAESTQKGYPQKRHPFGFISPQAWTPSSRA